MRSLCISLVCIFCICLPVPVPAADLYEMPPAASGTAAYTVQVETLSVKAKAEDHVRTLRAQGYPAYIRVLPVAGSSDLYKIRIGSYAAAREARAALQDYKTRTGREAFLVQVRSEDAAEKPPTPAPPAMRDEGAPPAARYFAIQTAAVLEKQPAERHLQQLRERGYPAYMLEKPAAGGKTLYQIRFGQYPDEPTARAAAKAYSEAEKRDHLVVRSQVVLDPAAINRPPEAPAPAPAPKPAPPARPAAGVAPTAVEEAEEWPDKTTTIYGYRWPDDELNLTNTYERIPSNLRHTIEYLSVYPVRCVGPDAASQGLQVQSTSHGLQAFRLAGVRFPSPGAMERAYAHCAEQYRDVPLRLKYNPNATSGSQAAVAQLHRKDGTSVNRELLRLGLGEYCPDTVVSGQEEDFQQAAAAAQAERRGIWAALQ